MPSPMLMPAASEATPVANGLTVERDHARAGAEEDDRRRDHAVVAERERQRHEQRRRSPSVSSHIPYDVPPSAKTTIRIAIRTEPLCRKRSASRPMPVWIASVFIVTVMNAPTASTKRKIAAEP